MIFTTRALQVQLVETTSPIEDFCRLHLESKKGSSYRKNVLFVRHIGLNENEEAFKAEIRFVDDYFLSKAKTCHYLRIRELEKVILPEKVQIYMAYYEEWERQKIVKAAYTTHAEQLFNLHFPVHFAEETLELTQKVAFDKVLSLYDEKIGKGNPSLLKNFAIKMLGWMAVYLPQLFSVTEKGHMPSKLVYIGEIKKQEVFFLYFLSLMGTDILYRHTCHDLAEIYPELKGFSTLFKEKHMGTGQEEIAEVPRMMQVSENGKCQTESKPIHEVAREAIAEECIHEGNREIATEEPITGEQTHKVCTTRSHSSKEKTEMSYEALAQLSDAVVMITVYNSRQEAFKSGSGVVISSLGYILTNSHVVAKGSYFGVLFENEREEYVTERVVKYHQEYDLAIIKVERRCKALPLYRGDKKLVRGQKVVAIGSPLGLFNSVSDGIISAFRCFENLEAIQFTAPSSHGSSGGALLNMYGELIGIIFGGFDDGQNLGLAVDYECIYYFANHFIE